MGRESQFWGVNRRSWYSWKRTFSHWHSWCLTKLHTIRARMLRYKKIPMLAYLEKFWSGTSLNLSSFETVYIMDQIKDCLQCLLWLICCGFVFLLSCDSLTWRWVLEVLWRVWSFPLEAGLWFHTELIQSFQLEEICPRLCFSTTLSLSISILIAHECRSVSNLCLWSNWESCLKWLALFPSAETKWNIWLGIKMSVAMM